MRKRTCRRGAVTNFEYTPEQLDAICGGAGSNVAGDGQAALAAGPSRCASAAPKRCRARPGELSNPPIQAPAALGQLSAICYSAFDTAPVGLQDIRAAAIAAALDQE